MSNDSGLPDIESLQNSSDSTIDEIIRSDREDKEREDAILNAGKNKKKVKQGAVAAVAVLGVSAIIAGGIFLNPFAGSGQKPGIPNAGNTTVSKNQNDNNANAENAKKVADPLFWNQPGQQYPVSLKPWQTTEYNNFKLDKTVVDNSNKVVPGSAAGLENLPGGVGITDDPNKTMLPNGTINPLYSYWTSDGFNHSVGFALQRFIDPIFGRWAQYEYPSAYKNLNKPGYLPDEFSDVFDPTYYNKVKNTPTKDWLPIFADWNGDSYGLKGKLLDNGPRWMGILDSVQSKFTYDDPTQSYSAVVTANVTYYAWTQTQGKLEKKGVITFDVKKGPVDQKYLISNAKLEIKQ